MSGIPFVVLAGGKAPLPIAAETHSPIRAAVMFQGRRLLDIVVEALAGQGLSRLFVEGGGEVASSFVRCGLIDALEWFRAPMLIGGEGRPGVGALAVAALAEAPHFRRIEVHEVGDDLWERYVRV